jgi:hypothetical protein
MKMAGGTTGSGLSHSKRQRFARNNDDHPGDETHLRVCQQICELFHFSRRHIKLLLLLDADPLLLIKECLQPQRCSFRGSGKRFVLFD